MSAPLLRIRIALLGGIVVLLGARLVLERPATGNQEAVAEWIAPAPGANVETTIDPPPTGTGVLTARNPFPFVVTLTVRLTLFNMYAKPPAPVTVELGPGERATVATLRISRLDSAWRYAWTFHWLPGSAAAVHDDRIVYDLPFTPGAGFPVTQGFHGSFSHYGLDSCAVDWRMPEGTEIRCAREGVVIRVKEDSDIGGPDSSFVEHGNYVVVLHTDGTMSGYWHLRRDGADVDPGRRVRRGDRLGFSGSTGFSRHPHLHFEVYRPRDGYAKETIPFRYATADSPDGTEPVIGRVDRHP